VGSKTSRRNKGKNGAVKHIKGRIAAANDTGVVRARGDSSRKRWVKKGGERKGGGGCKNRSHATRGV